MEQLLNLLWLMLILPAFLVWRFQLLPLQPLRRRNRSHSLVLLGCLLVLLFPIVSASDDLHPISAEAEESSPFKRAVKQSPGPKSANCHQHGVGPALGTPLASLCPDYVVLRVAPEVSPIVSDQVFVKGHDSRGPPRL